MNKPRILLTKNHGIGNFAEEKALFKQECILV